MKYAIDSSTLTGIADAVRNMRHETGTLTPAQIQAKIEMSKLGVALDMSVHTNPETGEWERPNDWPDIEALADNIVGDQDCVYLTYDLRKTHGYGWIGLYATTADKTSWTVDRGHISNNTFVSDETFSIANGAYLRHPLDETNGSVQLWRVISTGHITAIGFATNTSTNTQNYNNNLQPCVHRAGTLPWCVRWAGTVGTAYSSTCGGTAWLERDTLVPGKLANVTSLASLWQNCFSLQSVDLSKWDTSNWHVTTINSCWAGCNILKKLDVSSWNTSNWAVTNTASCWSTCYALEELDLSAWDTSNWVVTTIGSMWYACYSLNKLIVPWDTRSWSVVTFSSTWYYCYALQSLDLSSWDTSNWAVNTISGCWQNCFSLVSLKIGDWDTSDWVVTSLASTWRSCYKLLELDLSKWDTSKWAVTTLADAWHDCYSLQTLKVPGSMSNCPVTNLSASFSGCWNIKELNLNVWDTEKWAVTTLANLFSNCYSLKTLSVDLWDTSNWAVTAIGACWSGCESLQTINAPWNTSNWVVTSIGSTWNACYSLKSLNVPWNTSNWAVTTIQTTWASCFSLASLNINTWDTSNWAVTSMYNAWATCCALESLDISSWITTKWAITDSRTPWGGCYSLKSLSLPASLGYLSTTANASGCPNTSNLESFNGVPVYFNHSYSTAIKLTKQSLLNIIDKLPTISIARTVTLGQINKLKLTASEIAVATQKGWTVA